MVQASGVPLDDGACCINGCSRDVHARGMCRMHYDRWRRGGMGARKKRMSRACIQCGRFFETERRDKKTCSDKCRKAWSRKCRMSPVLLDSKPNPLKSVLWEPRANARVDVPVPVAKSFWTRDDEWNSCSHTCPRCGLALDRSADVMSGDYPVGVWKVPLEQGGENSLRNRVLVHRKCA